MDSPLLLSRDGYLLEPIVWPKGSQASCGDWREDSGLLSRPCRKRRPSYRDDGGLKSLLQHHSSKASILRHSAFFIVQLSHPYMTTGQTIALTRWNFVAKVMSLLSNMLSRLIMAFLPRSKHLFISWLQSPSAVILEPKKIMSLTVSTFSPSICHEVIGLDAVIFIFLNVDF